MQCLVCHKVCRDAPTLKVRSEQGGSLGLEGGLESGVGSALFVVGLGEPDRFLVELTDLSSSHISLRDDGSSDDLNRLVAGRVSSAHLHVQLGDGTVEGSVSVLLVHVDGDGTGQVSKNNSIILDAARLLLEDLAGGHDLSLNLSDLVLSLHVVPELAAGEHGVGGEHTHSEELGLRVSLRGVSSTDNVELSDLCKQTKVC